MAATVTYENVDRFNTVKGYDRYQNYDYPPFTIPVDEKSYAGTVCVGWKKKNPPVKGDHKGDFPYFTSGFKMLQDIPRSVHTHRNQEFYTKGYASRYNDVAADRVSSSWLSTRESLWTFGGRYPEVELPNLRSESITGSLNDLAENQVSLGASIAEGRQVIDMFASNVSILARAIIQAKRGNFSAIPKILGMGKSDIMTGRFAANKWLEYQYGWKPLMSEVADAQQKAHEVILQDYSLSGSKSASSSNTDSWDSSDGRRSLVSKLSVKTQIKATVSSPAVHSISSWGLINPAAIAWEIVPFSFVVDWFMPVGNTLNAATAGLGLTFAGGSTTTKRRAVYTWTGNDQAGWDETVLSQGSIVGESYEFQRDIWHEFPRAKFYADTTPFSTPRVANATALLRQLR